MKILNERQRSEIAVIGEKDIILPFLGIGYDVYFDVTKINELENYKIILITNTAAEKVKDYLARRASFPFPIIMPIPDGISNSNYGLKKIEDNIKKAIGSKQGENI
ncbi:MAG: hypothetical protein LBH47_00525 [Christensenellaceae bacterium]|jgi:V/A-type H+-transporting ATPase subunit F|nr:hypothetical protein [Christensenellaceae bacterium]